MSDPPWTLGISRGARRQLARLPEAVNAAIVETFQAIRGNPYRLGKPLRDDLAGTWAAHRGPYRVLYEVDHDTRTVTVVRVGHRADVYRPR